MPGVSIRRDEPIDNAPRSFKRQVGRAAILLEKREFYEKPSKKRKSKFITLKKRLLLEKVIKKP